jgi:chromosome segregation ATPase
MSWRVDGIYYHTWDEYQAALARSQENRLRRLVERLKIPRADTRGLESELAAAQARQQAVKRLSSQIEREASERREALQAQRRDIKTAFAEVEDGEQRLLRDLDGLRRRTEQQIEQLEEQRRVQSAATAASLESELAADRRDAERARERRRRFIAEAGEILDGWQEERLRALGLDAEPVRQLLERARNADDVDGLELARRAMDEARALAAEATARESRLKSMREIYRIEVEELLAALDFSSDDRRDLVGEGEVALDRPLRRELERLLERIDGVNAYEDCEARFDRIGQSIDIVTQRVSDIAAQVRDFDRLEEARLDLVRNHLEARLAESLGEDVRIDEVEPGELGLQPVEVKMHAASGEKIDCSISIDGTLRIHHYGHADQAACARAARKLAGSLPELMAVQGEPRLDVAATTTRSAEETTAGNSSARGRTAK